MCLIQRPEKEKKKSYYDKYKKNLELPECRKILKNASKKLVDNAN